MNKRFDSIHVILIAAAIALCFLLLPGDLFAAERTADEEARYCENYVYYANLTEDQKNDYNTICSAIESLNETVYLSGTISLTEAAEVLTSITYDHPEYFWYGREDMNVQGTRFIDSHTGKVIKVNINYNKYAYTGGDRLNGQLSLDALEKNIALIESEADKLLKGVGNAADYVIEKEIHDTLAKDLSYNWEEYKFNLGGNVDAEWDPEEEEAYLDLTIFNFLAKKNVICAGYARTFQYLMTRAKIPCYYAFGFASIGESSGVHAWNIVKIQGDFYGVDITWDDLFGETDSNGSPLDFNRIDYSFYNMTQKELLTEGLLEGYHAYDKDCGCMPQLCDKDTFGDFYGKLKVSAYLDNLEDPEGSPRAADITSLSAFKKMSEDYYRMHGEGCYWIPFCVTLEAYNEISAELNTNGLAYLESLASAGGFKLKSGNVRWMEYKLDMGVYYIWLSVRASSEKTEDTLFTGIKQGNRGNSYYYYEGIFQSDYSGMVEYDGSSWYVINGVWQKNYNGYFNTNGDTAKNYQWRITNGLIDTDFEGLYKVDGVWRYYRYGKFQDTTTGFATDMTRFKTTRNIYRYRVEKGLINFHFTGMAESGNARYYENGRWMNTYTGYCNNTHNLASKYEYYVKNGTVDTNYEGLYKVDGVWRYYRYGKFQDTTSGFATDMTRLNAGKGYYRYRVEKGIINFHFTGLAESNNTRYYKEGRWMNTFTGTVFIDGVGYNIKNGVVSR